jgi:hypothetical protein
MKSVFRFSREKIQEKALQKNSGRERPTRKGKKLLQQDSVIKSIPVHTGIQDNIP